MSSRGSYATFLFTCVAAMSMLASSCGQGGGAKPATMQQGRAKTIRCTVSGTPNIDPGVGLDYGSSIALANLYDTLVFPQEDGTVKPQLAEKWEMSPDALIYTFHLRKGVRFHSGEELDAADVSFSMQRLKTIGEGYAYLFTDSVKSVEALDPLTVKFTLTKPFGPFVRTLVRFYVLDKDAVMSNIQKNGKYGEMGDYGKDWLITHDAGSGPYIAQELKQQGYLAAVRFADYWGGWDKDAPDSFKLIDTTEGASVRTMMGNRELEITDMWQSSENIQAMSKIPGVSIAFYARGSIQNMMMNTKKAPTDDPDFRKALSYLFDYKMIEAKIFPGSKQARGCVSSSTPGHNPDVVQYSLDPSKASEYIQKSKYAGKLDQYPVELLVNTDVADHEKVALSFQAEARKAGIKVNISKAPWISITDRVSTPETTPNMVCIDVPVHYNEAGSMLETRYHSKSVGTWEQAEWLQDKKVDAAIADALSTIDQSTRFEKYRSIQKTIVNDICPTVWLVELNDKSAYQSDYVWWPAAESQKQGKIVTTLMGYHFYFHDFKVFPEKAKK